jgi:hypothetical protein
LTSPALNPFKKNLKKPLKNPLNPLKKTLKKPLKTLKNPKKTLKKNFEPSKTKNLQKLKAQQWPQQGHVAQLLRHRHLLLPQGAVPG